MGIARINDSSERNDFIMKNTAVGRNLMQRNSVLRVKSRCNRFLSFIIALALLLSVCPVVHADDIPAEAIELSVGASKSVNIENSGSYDYIYFKLTNTVEQFCEFNLSVDNNSNICIHDVSWYDSDMWLLGPYYDFGNNTTSNISYLYDFWADNVYYFAVQYSGTGSFNVSLSVSELSGVKGYITDAATGAPLSNVTVEYDVKNSSGQNDSGSFVTYHPYSGFYCFITMPGTADISYTRDGYNSVQIENIICESGKLTSRNLELENSYVQAYSVNSSQYMISVVDENGYPLSGACVTWQPLPDESGFVLTKYSGTNGIVSFDALTYENPIITVELDGYITWSNQGTAWEKSPSRFETVVMYPESVGNLKLSSARYSNYENMSMSTELLTTTKKVSLGNDAILVGDLDFGNFYISCRAKDNSAVSSYQLWQGRKKIQESIDGFFTLNSSSFEKGGGCFIKVITSNGDNVDTGINLVFEKSEINSETAVELSGDKFSFVVRDEVPFLGGSSFDVDMPFRLPIVAYASADKIKVGLNLNIVDKEGVEEAKKLCSEVRRLNGLNVGKLTGPQSRKFKSLIKDTNEMKFFKGGELNVLGYAEGDWGSSTLTGAVILQGKIDAVRYEFNTWCVVVPVTVQVELSLEGTASFEITYHLDTATFEGGLGITLSSTLKAFGGLGVSKLVGVGAYGSATLDGDIDILPTKSVKKIDLTGELGIKAYVAIFTYEKPFAYNTWHILPEIQELIPRDGNISEGEYSLYQSLGGGLYDASQYKKADLSYLNEEKDFMGTSADSEFTSRDVQGNLRTSFDSLIQNTYRNAQPVMVSTDDAIYAAFLRADAATGRVYTVVSKFDGTNWATPVETALDDTLDNMPKILVDNNGHIWLAYAQTDSAYDGGSMQSYAQNQKIVVGSIDPATLSFTQHQVYSGSGYAHMQELSLVNGVPTLVWISSETNTDNDVLWPEHNVIYQATYDGTSWSSAALVNSVDHVITELAVGEQDGSLTIACVTDQDNASETADDKQLLLVTGDGIQTIADHAGGVRFERIPGTDSSSFVWIDDGVVRNAAGYTVPIERITGEYYIKDNCIYYSVPTENGAELCVVKYENGEWSSPMTLTEGSGYLENISIAQLNGKDYVLGLYTSVSISDDGINDSKDLVWTGVSSVSDLRIDDLYFENDDLIPYESVPVTLQITNAGDHPVSSVDIYLDGAYVSTETLNLGLGQSVDYIIPVTCPDYFAEMTVSVSETDWTDYHPDDNTAAFKMGYPDLSVALQCRQIGTTTTVLGVVENEGIGSASGTLYYVNTQGDILCEQPFAALAASDSIVAAYEFDWDDVDENSADVRAILACNEEELYDYNNYDSIHLTYNGHRKTASPDVILPEMLTAVSDESFMGGRFKSVRLQEGVTSIGAKAFKGCDWLEQIEIPASVTYISSDAFEGTTGFVIFCPSGSTAEEYASAHSITCVAE